MMRVIHRYVLLLVLPLVIIGSACSGRSEPVLPTVVPAANPLLGPPGTNAINESWVQVKNSSVGIAIEHPQDWNSHQVEARGIRLTPQITLESSNNNTFTVVATVARVSAEELPAGVNPNDVMAVLEAIITDPTLGPANTIERIQPAEPVSIDSFTGAAVQLLIHSPEVDLPESESGATEVEDLGARNPISMVVVVMAQNGRTAVFTATTDVASMDTYRPIFDRMMRTVSFSE